MAGAALGAAQRERLLHQRPRLLVLVAPERGEPAVEQRVGQDFRVPELAGQRQGGVEVRDCGVVVALDVRQVARMHQVVDPQAIAIPSPERQDALQPVASLASRSPYPPEEVQLLP